MFVFSQKLPKIRSLNATLGHNDQKLYFNLYYILALYANKHQIYLPIEEGRQRVIWSWG